MADNQSVVYTAGSYLPQSLISAELEGLYGTSILAEMGEIIQLYADYENGVDFKPTNTGDFTASDLRYAQASTLINKEARFLFSNPPLMQVKVPYNKEDENAREQAHGIETEYQAYIDKVLQKNKFIGKLVKAAKDCFIGKRIAYFINFNEATGKITVDFVPSLEFVYEVDPEDITVLKKIVTFYIVEDSQNKTSQRIYKKKYWMESGYCHLVEEMYDGAGALIETLTPERVTKFTYIPAGVIINDGLTGDTQGESEMSLLQNYESTFSKIANADIDSERQNMNPIKYAKDMNPATTEGLSLAPGALWDIATDPNAVEGVNGEVGVLESSMTYSTAVDSTLNRIRRVMFETVSVPDTSAEALKGVVSSGKTLKAINWDLITRCDEKMLEWQPALEHIIQILIDGAKLYPKAAKNYFPDGVTSLKESLLTFVVENRYPLPEDEAEEKAVDLSEVNAQTMSKKAYMKKWRGLTDKEADNELKQIALENEMFENSFGIVPQGDDTEE